MSAPGDIFSDEGPRWYSIPSGRSFLDDLARGLNDALGDNLSSAQILTPTRRGARAMAQAFSKLARGGALLLPQIRAIGDLDEGEPPFDLEALALDLPPALSTVRRRFELARLITENYRGHRDEGLGDEGVGGRTALDLANSLAGFFDSLALEEIDAADMLDSLIGGEGRDQYVLEAWARHWQISAKFLKLAVHAWPERLTQLELMDPSQRQVTLIRRLVEQWQVQAPQTPLILAGSTGSAPAMADLMQVVACAAKGAVVLPGLDLSLADDVWAQIGESHPQGTMKRLLDRHGIDRAEVRLWPASLDSGRRAAARRRLLNEALRPAEATKDWLDQIKVLQAEGADTIRDGLDGLHEIITARDEEAASVIALLLRETLESDGKICALITPDITLARRVSARLTRWGLQADSSAGEPLSNSLSGRFLLDLLGLLREPHDPVLLLGLLRNPLCRFAENTALDVIEARVLRGARPTGIEAITARLDSRPEALVMWTDYVAALTPLLSDPPEDFGDGMRRFAALAEGLSLDDGQALWAGAAGAQASELLSDLIWEGTGFAIRGWRDFGDILTGLIRQAKVRTGGNTHPRLLILGAIEARLVTADRVILAGLEEGVWPQAPDLDPFLSRPMREKLGLPTPERRTGLSAHDFVQAASSPEVFLITRKRREGEPQVASRWLWRLQTLCKGAGVDLPQAQRYLDWARAMDRSLPARPASLKPAQQPNPKPPVTSRPMQMAVTEVEVFIRDPYAVYAKRILKLRALDRPNEPVEARQRGNAIHEALEAFVTDRAPLNDAGAQHLAGLFENALLNAGFSPAQMALQRPLLPGMAQGFIAFEQMRRDGDPRLLTEAAGEMTIILPRGDFTLKARADRIVIYDNGVDIIDFKTGGHASVKQVLKGFYPQLTLTAAIIRNGGFAGLNPGVEIGDMLYARLSPDETKSLLIREKGVASDDLADHALSQFTARIKAYEQPGKGYLSWAAPHLLTTRGGDYDQLARLYEWYVLGDDEASDDEVQP